MEIKDKKVMFITGSLTDGGAERVMSILASTCAQMGADVSMVILRNKKRDYPLSGKVKCFQIKADSRKFKQFIRIRELHRILKESDADTLITFLPIISLYTLIANIGVGKKVIISERGDPNLNMFGDNISMKDRIGGLLIRKLKLFRLADWLVFQTPVVQTYYGKRAQNKSSIIPNPLDTSQLPHRYEGERKKTVVAAGRFSQEKNFSLLIRGFAQFVAKYPEYRLVLYGQGVLKEALEQEVLKHGISHKVQMPGFSSHLNEEMRDAAMYVSTSNHEGISNSMLEALGMGIPTIATDCPVGGARMYVKTDVNGILIPMEDQKALVDAMEKIASNQKYAEAISQKATEIRNEIAAESICQRWLELC